MNCLFANKVLSLYLLSVFSLMVLRVGAVLISSLPSPQYLDTEVVTNMPFRVWQDGLCKFTYSLSFNATSSNNLEMAFGCDADKNGQLSEDEIGMIAGWDCGEWFLKDVASGEIESSSPVGDDGVHEFSCIMRLHSSGMIEEVTYTDNSTNIFPNVISAKPYWLYSSNWDLLRIVARGDNVRGNERFSARVDSKGLRIIFR
jgi:hypothetical protein